MLWLKLRCYVVVALAVSALRMLLSQSRQAVVSSSQKIMLKTQQQRRAYPESET